MRLLFIGDVVGDAGRRMIQQHLRPLREKLKIDVVICNAENVAGGNGITPQTFQDLTQAGCDVITGGNHSFDKKDGFSVFEDEPYCLRPANYPAGVRGHGAVVYTSPRGHKVGVLNVMGRIFMEPLDCPFQTVDRELPKLRAQTPVIVVDIHAEATSEKMAMGWHCDGRATLVVGTHSHVPTADERIFPKGTAYLTDAGMCGPYDSVIGVKKDIILERFTKRLHNRMEPADGNPWLPYVMVDADPTTGKALKIERAILKQNP